MKTHTEIRTTRNLVVEGIGITKLVLDVLRKKYLDIPTDAHIYASNSLRDKGIYLSITWDV